MVKKVGIVSLGCPKNLVDSEVMLGLIKDAGYEITNDEKEADVIIVNTCGFIDSAKQESINTILEMAQYKKDSRKYLIVTGCMAERYKEEIMKEMPEVDAVVGTGNYGEIADVLERVAKGERPVIYGCLDNTSHLENTRVISTKTGFAYLKIAEGCSNCCTYCIIPALRGPYRSRKIEDIVKEAKMLSESGVKEVILVAQDTTMYGIDLYGKRKLVELIRQLSNIDGIEWIRLLYCYPELIDEELINEIASNDKVCKYLDIPLQHISDDILKKMGRRSTSSEIKNLISTLRERIPQIILRTSLIVGFPGETDEDFALLREFIKEYRFDRLGIFTYSKEEGTPAAKLKPQVPKKVKEKRYNELMKLQSEIVAESNMSKIGEVYKTIVEGVAEDGIFYYGRSYAEAPDIDSLIYFTSMEPLETGSFVDVKILNTDNYDLIGEVVNESSK